MVQVLQLLYSGSIQGVLMQDDGIVETALNCATAQVEGVAMQMSGD